MHKGETIILEIGGLTEDDMAIMGGKDDHPDRMIDHAAMLLCQANEIYSQLPQKQRRKLDKHLKAKEEERMEMNRAENFKLEL